MADTVEYTFKYRGAYTGDETGRRYLYRPGQSFEAPKGEFDGMDSSRYETRPLRPGAESEASGYQTREYEVKGAYKDLYEDGQLVEKNVRCKKADAEAWADGDLTLDELQNR